MNNKGFTMVEIIAVVTILGLLAVITTPAYDSISKNIKHKNYESKKNTIVAQTLSYVEKYMKDDIYGDKFSSGTVENTNHCFTVGYLIQTGIISSDSEEDEYILNDEINKQYKKDDAYVLVWYDNNDFKLKAEFRGEPTTGECKETYKVGV